MNSTITLLNESGHWLVAQLGRMSVELAVLAGVVLVALHVLRVKSPALRHLFWGLLLAKPVLTFLVASPLSLYAVLWPQVPEVLFAPLPAVVQTAQAPLPPPIAPLPDIAPSAAVPRVETPPPWRQVDRYGLAMLAWGLVASLLGLRLMLGCAYVGFLRGTARTQKEGRLFDLVAEAARTLHMRRRVAVATTTVCHGPVLAGVFRPVILLPESMAAALTRVQLKLVITHELAHARRWDNLVLLIQRLAEMLFFFHPVVWLCGWMMRREAEAACDDMVVNAYGDADGAGAAAYADSLTRVAEMKCGVTRRLLVNTFAAAESNFHRRIRRILGGKRTRMTLWVSLATGAALVLIGVVGLPTVASAPPQDNRTELEKALDATGSIAFENQHLSEVFNFIADTDRINLVIDWRVVKIPPSISTWANTRTCGPEPEYVTDGVVRSLDVRNVSWREAIDALVKPLGLAAVLKDHYVWVSSPAMIARDAAQSAPEPQHPDPALLKVLDFPVSVEFGSINIREILDFVADSWDVQFAIDDTVVAPKPDSGQAVPPTCITNGYVPRIEIRNVPLSAMLEAVLRPLNLVAVPDGGVVRVTAYGGAGENGAVVDTMSQAPKPASQTAADPAVKVDSIIVDPKTGKASFANIRISGVPVLVGPGGTRGGYRAKSISADPPAVTFMRQSDGMEWNVAVDPAAVRTEEGGKSPGKAVLRLIDTQRRPRADIQTHEEQRGYWYRIGDEIGEYTVKEINDEAKTVLLAKKDDRQTLLLERFAFPGRSDDFESYAGGPGAWPDAWIADGNASDHAVCYVDGTTFKDTHGNTLRLHGDSPTWSPLAHLLTYVAPPFRMAFDVYLESGNPETTCVAGVRRDSSWKSPGVILFDTTPPGEVKGLEPVAGGGVMSKGQSSDQLRMTPGKWHHVELVLREEQEKQSLTVTLDDGTAVQGPAQLAADDVLVDDMPFLQLEVRSGTAWFDNVSMEPLAADGSSSEQAKVRLSGENR